MDVMQCVYHNSVVRNENPKGEGYIMNDNKGHVVRARGDEETKKLEQISKETEKSVSEIIRDGFESQKNVSQQSQNYVEYDLYGFENLKLKENKRHEMIHPLIRFLYIADDITSMTVTLNENVHYNEHCDEIEKFLDHVCFNLIVNTEVDVYQPVRILKSVHDEDEITFFDQMGMTDNCSITRNYNADSIYKVVIDTETAIDNHNLMYERIFKTLQNPNLIMQYLGLYQFLMELLSKGKEYPCQANVINYFKNHQEQYPYISFKQTRKKRKKYKEDTFTYVRNEIGHCEETNDLAVYKEMGKKVDNRLIKRLVSVLNDVINQLDFI